MTKYLIEISGVDVFIKCQQPHPLKLYDTIHLRFVIYITYTFRKFYHYNLLIHFFNAR